MPQHRASWLTVLAGALAGVSTPTAAESAVDTQVANIVREAHPANGPGAAVLVLRKGRMVHSRGYGLANLKDRRPITPQSVFDLGSLSKQLTAMAVMILKEQSALKFDDAVSKYLKDYDVPARGRDVTIRDLLQHGSGLADYTSDDWEGSDREFAQLTPARHLQWLNEIPPRRAPGKKYEYNNTNYALLALVVERVSRQSFAEFMRRRVFEPLKMRDTRVVDRLGLRIDHSVTGYIRSRNKTRLSSMPVRMTGDGNVFSTAEDLGRWVNGLRENSLVSAKTLAEAWTPGELDSGKKAVADTDGPYYYGFGWEIDPETNSVFHTGSWYGTATYLVYYRDEDLAVIVLSNDEEADVDETAESIANLFD